MNNSQENNKNDIDDLQENDLQNDLCSKQDGLLEKSSFILCLIGISLLFCVLVEPFAKVFFWACVLALVFYPIFSYFNERKINANNSALLTVTICFVLLIIPIIFLLLSLIQEGTAFYNLVKGQSLEPSFYVNQVIEAFPVLNKVLYYFNINIKTLDVTINEWTTVAYTFIAQKALAVGSETLNLTIDVVMMLYLMFFMIRDGMFLRDLLIKALPLGDEREHLLLSKFAEVTRATIKGTLVVAIVQGALGGLAFFVLEVNGAILWGTIMILLSFVPVVGVAIVWLPVAIYFLAVGTWVKGVILILFGVFVIGLVDNVLRPILVGRDTKLPDYLVLLSTLGGFTLFGFTGFIVGPLIAVLFVTFWNIFICDFNHCKI